MERTESVGEPKEAHPTKKGSQKKGTKKWDQKINKPSHGMRNFKHHHTQLYERLYRAELPGYRAAGPEASHRGENAAQRQPTTEPQWCCFAPPPGGPILSAEIHHHIPSSLSSPPSHDHPHDLKVVPKEPRAAGHAELAKYDREETEYRAERVEGGHAAKATSTDLLSARATLSDSSSWRLRPICASDGARCGAIPSIRARQPVLGSDLLQQCEHVELGELVVIRRLGLGILAFLPNLIRAGAAWIASARRARPLRLAPGTLSIPWPSLGRKPLPPKARSPSRARVHAPRTSRAARRGRSLAGSRPGTPLPQHC
ncbi:hypothetical protein L1887_53699 [Cichorium endivia]|nr:hypothetical protein L1887_53699 [Cichorium endivia]